MTRADHKRAARDPITAALWNSVVERLPQERFGVQANPAQISRVLVEIKNDTGHDLKTGDWLANNGYTGPSDPLNAVDGTINVLDPLWQSRIASVVIAAEPILAGEYGLAVASGVAVAKVDEVAGRTYAMFEYLDSTKGKAATGGPVQIIGTLDATNALVIVGNEQQLWRYELSEDVTGSGAANAKLLNLDDSEFAPSIQLQMPSETTGCLKSGDRGYCFHAGNDFYALTTAAALLGTPQSRQLQSGPMSTRCQDKSLCFDQGAISAFVFPTDCELEETDPAPTGQVFCLDQSLFDCLDLCGYICEFCDAYSNDPDCYPPPDCCGNCDFPDDAISGLVLNGPAGQWRQSGASAKTDNCCFTVPVELDGSSPTDATVCYDGSGTWSATGPWGTVTGPGSCSGSVPLADGEPPTWDGYMDVTGTTCDPPPPPPCGTCDWTWDAAGGDWVLASDACINDCVCVKPSAAGTTDGEQATTECESPPPCGTCSYLWNAAGGKWDLVSNNCTLDCVCVEPPITGSEQDGDPATTECEAPPGTCCDYGGDAYVRNFVAVDGLVTVTQINNLDPIVATGVGCNAEASFLCNAFDGQNNVQCNAKVTLRYDPGCPGCVWDVEVTGSTLPGGSADGTGVAGQGCIGNMNTFDPCGTGNTTWDQGANFDVIDPTNAPTCVDPNAVVALSASRSRREGRISRALRNEAPELFTGRSCTTRDIMKLMDAWGVEKSARDIDRVADEFLTSLKSSKIQSHRDLGKDAVKQIVLNVLRKLQ